MSELVIIKYEQTVAKISLIGAELVSLTKNGQEFIWQGDERFWVGHAPILFPVCGGFKDDIYYLNGKAYFQPKHGFARHEVFSLYEKTENSATFLLTDSTRTYQGFPFRFRFFVKFVLTDCLTVTYKVENMDPKTMYFTLGAHEGYALDDNFENYSIVFEENENLYSYHLKNNLLEYTYTNLGENTTELVLNYRQFERSALVFKDIKSRKVWLKNKTKGTLLEVDFSDYNHLLLWTKPNAKYICIEPWIAVPDMVDTDQDITQKPNVVVINSKGSKSFIHTIKINSSKDCL